MLMEAAKVKTRSNIYKEDADGGNKDTNLWLGAEGYSDLAWT